MANSFINSTINNSVSAGVDVSRLELLSDIRNGYYYNRSFAYTGASAIVHADNASFVNCTFTRIDKEDERLCKRNKKHAHIMKVKANGKV